MFLQSPPFMFRFLLFLSFSLLLSLPQSSFAAAKNWTPTGHKLVDGDTFWVLDERGAEVKVRLIGINTPESRRTGRTEVEYFGKEASAYVAQLLNGRRIRLEYDVAKYDRYKRTLAYVYLDNGTFLNAHLIQEGYATVATYPPNVKYSDTSPNSSE
ncbi:thermonuclease [Daphnia sinensis]|uniref:Thermonuclease n=1 Tax=Daphnia sinensis TaxID=1820382 RepID=A0AAD5PNM4_9CRUS|nr:thermonuclease [Daphnia sinensis]